VRTWETVEIVGTLVSVSGVVMLVLVGDSPFGFLGFACFITGVIMCVLAALRIWR